MAAALSARTDNAAAAILRYPGLYDELGGELLLLTSRGCRRSAKVGFRSSRDCCCGAGWATGELVVVGAKCTTRPLPALTTIGSVAGGDGVRVRPGSSAISGEERLLTDDPEAAHGTGATIDVL